MGVLVETPAILSSVFHLIFGNCEVILKGPSTWTKNGPWVRQILGAVRKWSERHAEILVDARASHPLLKHTCWRPAETAELKVIPPVQTGKDWSPDPDTEVVARRLGIKGSLSLPGDSYVVHCL